MKQFISTFAFTLLISPVFAQGGFYVKGGMGAGTSGSAFKVYSKDAYKNKNAIASGQAQLNLGYTHGNLQIEGGVGYLLTGTTFSEAYGTPLCGGPRTETGQPIQYVAPKPVSVQYTIRNHHFVMPLIVSYAINKGKRVSFYPGIGVVGMYNFKGKIGADREAGQEVKMYYEYNKQGIMAAMKFDVQCRVSKNLSVWVGPSYQHMLTSLTKKVANDNMSQRYDHALLLSAGVRYDLHCPMMHCPFQCSKSAKTAKD